MSHTLLDHNNDDNLTYLLFKPGTGYAYQSNIWRIICMMKWQSLVSSKMFWGLGKESEIAR